MKRIQSLITISLFCASISAFAVNSLEDLYEAKKPTAEQLASGQTNYQRYCSSCHGKDGNGKVNMPNLAGSSVITGPMGAHVYRVLTGKSHTEMPAWGVTQLSDQVIADIITYQRNAWGNNDKAKYGEHAGGEVPANLIEDFRKALELHTIQTNTRT